MTGGGLGSFLSASVFWLTGACCGGIVVKKFAVPAVACVIRVFGDTPLVRGTATGDVASATSHSWWTEAVLSARLYPQMARVA